MSRISVLLVEDHFLPRMALSSILNARSDMALVAMAENGSGAVTEYGIHHPNVTIMDLRLPDMSGFDAIAAIRAIDPKARVLVLTNSDRSEDIYRAFQSGASGYLLKSTTGAELVNAILATHSGLKYIPRGIGDRLAERLGTADLTSRELEVLALLAHGLSNREIADRLEIAEKTARIHVSNILSKMGVSDRTQAAIAAIQRGLVELE
jgi:DNA-binding NarL/FixJ family response regulator